MDTAVRFPTSQKAAKAATLKLSKRASVEQAFQAIVRNCIDQVQGNEAGVSRYRDPESLHQMRVGLRRLNAAFALFRDLLHVPPEFMGELNWLMNQLGPARDWSVFIESTLPRIVAVLPGRPELDTVRDAALEKSAAFSTQACAAVSSARFGKLLSALEHWVEQRGWRDDLPVKGTARLKTDVSSVAGAIVKHEQQRLLKRGRKLKQAGAGQRHRVRIAAKRARYATEFFASLYSGKRVRPYVQALSGLQDQLGWLNDATVAIGLLDEAGQGNDRAREGVALMRGYLAASGDKGVRELGKSWKKFKAIEAPH